MENSENSKSKDSLSKQILDALKDDSDESAEKAYKLLKSFLMSHLTRQPAGNNSETKSEKESKNAGYHRF